MAKLPNVSQSQQYAPCLNLQTMAESKEKRASTPVTSSKLQQFQQQNSAHTPKVTLSSEEASSEHEECDSPKTLSTSAQETSIAIDQNHLGIEVDISPPSSPTTSSSATDAGYETDSIGSTTTSLATSVTDFAFENGRRYHRFREGAYNFPNDDVEQDREDMKHAMTVMACGQLHFAPLRGGPMKDPESSERVGESQGANILDLGTGTGIWCMEMGDLYPGAIINGVDLSPIQPAWVPPNVKFIVDDVESPWLYPPDHFDYIHTRHTVMAIRDWPQLMRNARKHLKPGGWLELQEIHHYPYCHDGSLPPDHPICDFWAQIIRGLAVLGVNFDATLDLETMMIEAGYVNVSTRIFYVPIGPWPKNKVLKTVGLFWRTILLDGAQPIALGPMTRGLKWSKEEIEVWLVEIRKAYMDPHVHSHMPLHIICGQKSDVV